MKYDKHRLYQLSVQDPEHDAKLYLEMASCLRPEVLEPRSPLIFREDFCGSFALSCAWTKLSPFHFALALDLDDQPLAYGRKKNLSRLKPQDRPRVKVMKKNVMSVTRPKADFIVAGNFSLFYIKEREALLKYLRCAYQSLTSGGLLFLEVVGGEGFTKKMIERKTISLPNGEKFTYTWQQRGYDPLSQEATYSIHFKLPDGTQLKDAFTYDWRLWNIRELREALLEAGFDQTHVFWEDEKAPAGYRPMEKGTDDPVWIAYVVGERARSRTTARAPRARPQAPGGKAFPT
jgi:hypothetical protein